MQSTPTDVGPGDEFTQPPATGLPLRSVSTIDFRLIAEESLSLIVVTDDTGAVQYVNPTFCEATGFGAAEVIGRKVQDLGELDPATLANLREALEFGHAWRGEFCTLKKSGDTFWLHASVSPVTDNNDRVTHFIAVGLDISERKRAEEALQESEGRFRRLAETTTAATLIFDGAHIRYANSAAANITGYSVDELVGKNFWEIAHPDLGTITRKHLDAVSPGERIPARSEIGIVTKDGQTRWLDLNLGFIDIDGKELVLGTGFDITERRLAEQALRDSEEKFRRLAESVPAGTFVFQGTGFQFVNTAMEELFGYTADEYSKMDFWETVHPDFRQIVKERGLARQRGEPVPSQYEVKALRKDGQARWALVTANLIEYRGSPAVIGSIMDVTDGKAAEEALRESEEKFRTLVDTMPAAAVIFQGNRIRYANRMILDALGYTADDLATLNYWDAVHPDFRDLVRERGNARLRGEDVPSSYEVCYLTNGGEPRWGLYSAAAITYEGEPAVIGTIYDITERKAAEEALQRNQQQLQLALDSGGMRTWEIGIKRRGPARAALFDAVLRRVCQEDRARVAEALRRSIDKGAPFNEDFRIQEGGGSQRWLGLRGVVAHDSGEKTRRLVGVLADITERKTAEEALRQSEERFRILYQDNPSMYFTLAEDLSILSVNQHGAEQLGHGPDDLIGQPVLTVVHPDDQAHIRRQFESLLKHRAERHGLEFRKVRKDGEVIWVKESIRLTHDVDGSRIILVVCEDITERKHMEEALQGLREDLEHKAERAVAGDNPYNLSFRELTVLHLVTGGRSDKEIGVILGIRPQTVSKHVANVRKKMRASSRTEAGVRALREGLVK